MNADQISTKTMNIPDGILNTSTMYCNYINCCYMDYIDGGVYVLI